MIAATYNLHKGRARRVHWVTLVERHNADLLLVQESYPPLEHLPPSAFPEAGNRCAWEAVGQNR